LSLDGLWIEPFSSANCMGMDQAVDDRNQVAVAGSEGVFEIGNGSIYISTPSQKSSYFELVTEQIASIAHEIRNPLASIKGVADAFLERGQLTLQEREWMEAVGREVLKIDARMRELLDVSHPRIFKIGEFSLQELVRDVVVLAESHVRSINGNNGRHQISLEFTDTTTEPVILVVDPARIEDAILNLILNGIEAIEAKGRVTVCLRTRANISNGSGEALIEVSDTGCGIPVEIRNRIFEPRLTTKPGGTGLGLAAVRRTAAAHHGRITFKTRIGRGSKFTLSLPLRSQEQLTESQA